MFTPTETVGTIRDERIVTQTPIKFSLTASVSQRARGFKDVNPTINRSMTKSVSDLGKKKNTQKQNDNKQRQRAEREKATDTHTEVLEPPN